MDTQEIAQDTQQELSVDDAFKHFWATHVEPMKRKPNELSAALCAFEGKAKGANGNPTFLGLKRLKRLFNVYAKGRYEIKVTVLVK